MTIDAHLKLYGVDGESSHKDHKGEIDLLGWRWDVRQDSSAAMRRRLGQGQGHSRPARLRSLLRQGLAGAGKELRQRQALRAGRRHLPQGGRGPAGLPEAHAEGSACHLGRTRRPPAAARSPRRWR